MSYLKSSAKNLTAIPKVRDTNRASFSPTDIFKNIRWPLIRWKLNLVCLRRGFAGWFLIVISIVMITPDAIFGLGLPMQSNGNSDAISSQALRLTAKQADEIKIDGILSEACWQNAEIATGLKQREPDESTPASERTEIRVVYDENTLYLGVIAHDSQPEKIISRILQRDKVMFMNPFDGKPYFSGDDAIAILLDPFHDHRNAVVFATNPNGAEFDALVSDEGQDFNIDWRAIWRVEARRVPQGWSAEFAIPFRTLRYPSSISDEPWGFNIYRVIRHKNEEVLWSAWSRDNEGFTRVSKAGHLYGMHDLPRPGLNLELKPYTLTGGTQEVDDFSKTNTN
ncbi:MAG: carbohydrate binding family 9 domain-containing protein, partial [bacterium]